MSEGMTIPTQLKIARTASQDMALQTGKCRTVARAALNAVDDDGDAAFKLLMSELELTVIDGLDCEIVPLAAKTSIWLGDDTTSVRSVGAFSGCLMLRVARERTQELRLFALEAVDACVLTESKEPIALGWTELEYTEAPDIGNSSSDGIVQTRSFDPGIVTVPVSGASLLLVRVVRRSAPVPPKNSRMPKRLKAVRRGPSQVELGVETAAAEEAGSSGESPSKKTKEKRGGDNSSAPPAKKRYQKISSVGKGAFGTVYLAKDDTGMQVAMKCVQKDVDHRSREVDMLTKVHHPFVVRLIDSFVSADEAEDQALNIVMEYVPENLHSRIAGKPLRVADVRSFSFQLLRALAHLDGLEICHRDIKPENVLIEGYTLKLGDFGSAKVLKDGSGLSSSYICSRWWRAPELVLGTTDYTRSVDRWSCGCVIAEMMLGIPIFRGKSSWGQMYQIIRALGSPTLEEVHALNPCGEGRITQHLAKLADTERRAMSWKELLPAFAAYSDALDLVAKLLTFDPSARCRPGEALRNNFFSLLPQMRIKTPDAMFSFTEEELSTCQADTRTALLNLANGALPDRRRQRLKAFSKELVVLDDQPALKRRRTGDPRSRGDEVAEACQTAWIDLDL